jgi:hypothetical protein
MLRKAMLLVLLGMPLMALAQAGGDLQAQIVYAYQTEDLNALLDLEAGLRTRVAAGEGDATLHYHLAHAAYRHALLASREKGAAGHAAGLCIDELKEILRQDAHNVEALVLQSACYARQAESSTLEAVLLRRLSSERLKEALRLAPRNPRALLFVALGGPGPDHPLAQLKAAADAFGQASATATDVPGWGDAEAYLALGQEMQRHGDTLGARNWIERALIASPDYKAAQRARLDLVGH